MTSLPLACALLQLFRYVLAYLRDVVTTQRECRRPSAQQQHQGDQHHLRPQQQQATGMDGSLPGCSHRRAAAAGSTAANDTSMPASTRPLEAHNTSQAHHGTSAAHEVSLQNGYSGQGPSGQGQGGALRVQQGAVGRGRGQSKYLLPQTSRCVCWWQVVLECDGWNSVCILLTEELLQYTQRCASF